MIGPFINALPVRVVVDRAASVRAWLQSLQAQQSELRQHESSALADIQGWSEVPRGKPLFETSVAFDNYPAEPTAGGSALPVTLREGRYVDWNSYPLSLDVAPREELSISFKYNVGRFAESAIAGLARDFEIVLESFAAGLDGRVEGLLDPLERADRLAREEREREYQSAAQQKLKGIRRKISVPG
jgi:non-ribosomal peptide synthetase component F